MVDFICLHRFTEKLASGFFRQYSHRQPYFRGHSEPMNLQSVRRSSILIFDRNNRYFLKIKTGSKRLGARSIFYNLQISRRARIEKFF